MTISIDPPALDPVEGTETFRLSIGDECAGDVSPLWQRGGVTEWGAYETSTAIVPVYRGSFDDCVAYLTARAWAERVADAIAGGAS